MLADTAPDYVAYHDEEWGRRCTATRLFERLTLEAFQSGLSWMTILRKRDAFRAAFAGFAIRRRGLRQRDVERLLADAGIVRNRAKIEAAVANARAVLDDELSDLVWRYAEPRTPRRRPWPTSRADPGLEGPGQGAQEHGFRFVGPTIAYALMQAIGLVNDHVADCWMRETPEGPREHP